MFSNQVVPIDENELSEIENTPNDYNNEEGHVQIQGQGQGQNPMQVQGQVQVQVQNDEERIILTPEEIYIGKCLITGYIIIIPLLSIVMITISVVILCYGYIYVDTLVCKNSDYKNIKNTLTIFNWIQIRAVIGIIRGLVLLYGYLIIPIMNIIYVRNNDKKFNDKYYLSLNIIFIFLLIIHVVWNMIGYFLIWRECYFYLSTSFKQVIKAVLILSCVGI